MRDASDPPAREGFTCPSCGRFIVTRIEGLFSDRKSGSPPRFCDPACRQAAYRRRRAAVAEKVPAQRSGGRSRSLRPRTKGAQETND